MIDAGAEAQEAVDGAGGGRGGGTGAAPVPEIILRDPIDENGVVLDLATQGRGSAEAWMRRAFDRADA